MSWADAPVAGRRPCRWSSPITGTDQMAPPRSAVTVSPSAPALTRLTGFSRSGSPSSRCWLLAAEEAPLRPSGLAKDLRLGVDNRWTTGVSSVSERDVQTQPVRQPPGSSNTTRRLLHVWRCREGLKPSSPGLEPGILVTRRATRSVQRLGGAALDRMKTPASVRSNPTSGRDHLSPLVDPRLHRPKGLVSRGGR